MNTTYDARTMEMKIAGLLSDVALLTKLVADQQEQIGSLQQGYLEIVATMKKLSAEKRGSPRFDIALPTGVTMQRKSDG